MSLKITSNIGHVTKMQDKGCKNVVGLGNAPQRYTAFRRKSFEADCEDHAVDLKKDESQIINKSEDNQIIERPF